MTVTPAGPAAGWSGWESWSVWCPSEDRPSRRAGKGAPRPSDASGGQSVHQLSPTARKEDYYMCFNAQKSVLNHGA